MSSDEPGYLRGAFIAYEPGGYPDKKRTITFHFNPEGLQRKLAVEQGSASGGTEGAKKSGSGTEQGADASAGTVKETLSLTLRFDAVYRPGNITEGGEDIGVAGELAALEDLLHPPESEADMPSDGKEAAAGRKKRATVIFVWGRKRLLPVKIVGMDMNETLHNANLYPIRAEVQVALEVLTEAHAKDDLAVQDALNFTAQSRRSLAKAFYDAAASQSTKTLPV